jgi:uncharacterized membrane protein
MAPQPAADLEASGGIRGFLRQAFVTGTAIVVPVLITIVVLFVGFDLLSGLIAPLVIPIDRWLGGPEQAGLLAKGLAVIVLGTVIFAVGAAVESEYGGDRIERGVDRTMAHIPGIGSVYGTLTRMSDTILRSDTDSFQEVLLVEYPGEGAYSVAFKTATPPAPVADATGSDDMVTVFMPMGPNPFMGGFILHVREERVHDVDLSVEEGISSIVSFGVAIDEDVTLEAGEVERADGPPQAA